MKHFAIKISALFSSCGGPLFVFELLKPRLGVKPAFFVTYLPVGLMVIGALCLDDPLRDRWSLTAVQAGRLGLIIALLMHAYALWCFVSGARVSEQWLYYFGIAVGVAWSVAYLRAARRWMPSSAGSSARDPASTEPIEPS